MQKFLEKYHIEDEVFAVGVSGGSDSLALALWLDECLRPIGKRVVALTVDHQLRAESADEAAYVHKVMQEKGIEHYTLVWHGDKPRKGIEEAARLARYQLLRDWCYQHDVRCLCVAHHQLDQAETFIIRLQRGSGLSGLCGMQEVSEQYGLKILRPFLGKKPEELKEFLRIRHIQWVTDSSNDCDDFLRVRVRKFLPKMEAELGISSQRIAETMDVLNRSRIYIDGQVTKFIKQHVRFWEKIGCSVALSLYAQQHGEIIYRVLAELIKQIGHHDYTARADDIERLSLSIFEDDFKGATLGNCEIFVFQQKLWIVPELKLKTKLPKKVWDDFVRKHPGYDGQRLPYKLRVALVKQKMNVEF